MLRLGSSQFDPGRVKTLVLAVNTRILEKCILQLDAVSASSAAVSDSLRKHFRFGCSAHEFSHGLDPLLPSAIQSSCVAVFLFDQLVRAQQDRCRHIEAKRLGGRHIEHGLVFHRQLHRQIGRLLALKDAVDVGGGAASMAYLVRPI